MLTLFAATLFVSGALLFVLEPMFAKMVLPKLGGTPAVWNVCMVFYQSLLLAGYVYAHELAKRLTPRRAALLQVTLIVLALFALPVRLPDILSSPIKQNPVLLLLGLLTMGIGIPFLTLTTYSSTLQTWYAAAARGASEPYVLYSASNMGSALGLFAYPLLLERYAGLTEQSRLWERGYLVLLAFTFACAVTVWWLAPQPEQFRRETEKDAGPPIARAQQFKWLVLAFIPSSLMLGVTTALTTELPPIPLLWVLPLALYLLSFILVFARKPITYHRTIVETLPILLMLVAFPIASKSVLSPSFLLLFYLLMLFFACMACHGELAISRPPAGRLTHFYLCLSIGGVLGGLFNAIVAPVIFKSVVELPLVLFFLALAISYIGPRTRQTPLNRWDLVLPGVLGLVIAVISIWLRSTSFEASPITNLAIFAGPILLCFSFARRPLRFALGLGALFLASGLYPGQYGHVLRTERSFFGVYRVSEDGQCRELMHGSTIHGIQSMDPRRSREPLSYFYKTGPIGEVFLTPSIGGHLREVAIVGLGAGTLACYQHPWRHFTYYEIDPTVERIARDPRYFTFLRDCSPGTRVVIGDARLSLQDAPPHNYDLIVADAFSSDTVPAHLITREAIELYLSKLAEHGLLAFNISNRYLDLQPVLGAVAEDAGLVSLIRDDSSIDAYEQSRGKFASTWLLMARNRSDFSTISSERGWQHVYVKPGTPVWTDDYSSVVLPSKLDSQGLGI